MIFGGINLEEPLLLGGGAFTYSQAAQTRLALDKWNDFFWPLVILKDQAKYTLPVALASLQNLPGQELGAQLLGSAIAIMQILIPLLAASRQFMVELIAGAIKH